MPCATNTTPASSRAIRIWNRLPGSRSKRPSRWTPVDPALPSRLGPGEAAALSLAMAQNARAVLLDEAYGRRIARQHGLPVVGTLSVLLAAKQAGLLPAVRPVLGEMVRQGRRISARLQAQVLRAAGE